MGVLIIDCEGVRLRFVIFVVFAELSVVGDGGVEGFAGREGSFQCGALGGDFGIAEGESTTVEVIAALPGLSADHGAIDVVSSSLVLVQAMSALEPKSFADRILAPAGEP